MVTFPQDPRFGPHRPLKNPPYSIQHSNPVNSHAFSWLQLQMTVINVIDEMRRIMRFSATDPLWLVSVWRGRYDAERLQRGYLISHLNKNKFSPTDMLPHGFTCIQVLFYLLCPPICLLLESFLLEMLPTIWCYTRRNWHLDNAVLR